MAGSTKAESASNSFDGSNFGSGFSNGQRGILSRSGSFRNAAMSSAEIPHANQYMSLEPYGTNDLKNVRSGELRRVLGVSLEDHLVGFSHWKPPPPVSWEELKRFKGTIEENSSRAKDRVKSLQDSVLKLDRYRNLISKKHQRIENQSNDKSSNSNLLKTESQAHQRICENLNPKLEKKTRNSAPNKRARSSITEAQATSYSLQSTLPSRQGKIGDANKSAPVDKDKHMLRSCNGASIPITPAGLKRRRSLGLPQWNNTRIPSDGDKDLKHSTNVRVRNESYPRSSDNLGFRSGLSNGNAESGSSQLSSGSSHILPGIEFGNGLLSNDRRERTTLKGSYKMNTSEDGQFGNQSPLTRGKASRHCRTSSSVPMDSCKPEFPFAPVATIDRTKWAAGGQRSRGKNSNSRKTNLVSPVSNSVDASQSDDRPIGPIVESGVSLFGRDSVQNTTLNLKSKTEINSDIHEVKKRTDNSGIEGRSINVHQKAVSVLPTKKKVTGDGVRRQGRSGRGTVQSKACPQMNKEKSVDLDTTKPMKSRKLVLDKLERTGFPLSKKASERKGPNRCGQNINFSSVELAGESDDDREELLAAAKAVNDGKCTGLFWESMEPIFSPIKPEEFSFLKHQVTHNDERLENDMPAKEIIPLSQRLLSSLITEEEIEMMDSDIKAQHEISHYSHDGSPYSPYFTQSLSAFHTNTASNGFRSPINFSSSGNFPQENGYVGNSNKRDAGIVHSGFIQDRTNHVQYEKMSLDDKVLIELHSIGIYPDIMIDPDEEHDNEMDKVLSELTNVLHQQMTMKIGQFRRLEKVILEQKESQMRNLEQLAMNELVEKAYNKLMVGRQKSGSSKVSKQHALAFAKRTIVRCQKFEETGQSCFREPFLRDVLFPQCSVTNLCNNMDGNDTEGTAVISSVIAPNAQAHDTQSGSQIFPCNGPRQILEGHGSPPNTENKNPLDSHQSHNDLMVQSLFEKGLTINKEEKEEVTDDAFNITPILQNGGAKQKQPQEDPIRDSVTENCSEKKGTSKGEQKTKSMQKIAEISSFENCRERITETAAVMPNIASEDALDDTRSSANDLSEDKENNMIFSENIDELGEFGHDDDIDSWLNVVDDSIQDTEFVGLQIPMDDLSDIKLDF